VGRLTADPELKYNSSGTPVCNLTLAVNRPFSNQAGQKETDFINVVIWRKPAENTANYMKKGSLLGVTGRWTTRNYENSEGRRVYVNELVAESVQFLESKKSGNNGGNSGNTGQYSGFNDSDAPPEVKDDDLPF
jgi:single-strand DNA-binding protein